MLDCCLRFYLSISLTIYQSLLLSLNLSYYLSISLIISLSPSLSIPLLVTMSLITSDSLSPVSFSLFHSYFFPFNFFFILTLSIFLSFSIISSLLSSPLLSFSPSPLTHSLCLLPFSVVSHSVRRQRRIYNSVEFCQRRSTQTL